MSGNSTVVLVGGAGYIGSVIAENLLYNNDTPIIIDNLARGTKKSVPDDALFYKGNMADESIIATVTDKYSVDAAVFLAAKTDPADSFKQAGAYWKTNTQKTIDSIDKWQRAGLENIIYSSTASVYGEQNKEIFVESMTPNPITPYGRTKQAVEQYLADSVKAYDSSIQQAIIFRYFNVAGTGRKKGNLLDPGTLIPTAVQKAINGDVLTVNGSNYSTPDGTCIRDYVHIKDVARAHCRMVDQLESTDEEQSEVINIGRGSGYSVHDVVECVRENIPVSLDTRIGPRRPGDSAVQVACIDKLQSFIDWTPQYELEDMIYDTYTTLREG